MNPANEPKLDDDCVHWIRN